MALIKSTAFPSGAFSDHKNMSGKSSLGGTNPTVVKTGFAELFSFTATLEGSAAPGVGTSVLTVTTTSGGDVNVYAWKPTSATDPTLVASTGTEVFNWTATGK
ncbi:MAG: hypothetical protein ACR2FY_15045 [Pirellulaceae bacterium]